MMAATLLDDITRRGSDLILSFIGKHYSESFVVFRPVKSTHHGEIFASREAGTALKHRVETEVLASYYHYCNRLTSCSIPVFTGTIN